MVERSRVFNLRRALKDGSASQELAGDIESSLCSFSTAGNMHLTFGSMYNYILFCHNILGEQKILCSTCPKVWGMSP